MPSVPAGVLPNGQIVDGSTGLVETLEAVKPYYDEAVKNGDPRWVWPAP